MDFDDKFALLERTQAVMAKPDSGELALLKAFYGAWERLQDIGGDRRKPEVRAQYEAAEKAFSDATAALRGKHESR